MNPGTGLFCQVTVTQPQAALLSLALQDAAATNDDLPVAVELRQLEEFFTFVSNNPRAFPPTGRMAKSIKSRLRRL